MSNKNFLSRLSRKKFSLVFTVFMIIRFSCKGFSRLLLHSEGFAHEAVNASGVSAYA